MQKLSDIVSPLLKIKEKLRLDEDKKVIDQTIEVITRLGNRIKNQEKRIVDAEQANWENEVARKQMLELGFTPGKDIVYMATEKPKTPGKYIVKNSEANPRPYSILTFDGNEWQEEEVKWGIKKYMKLPKF